MKAITQWPRLLAHILRRDRIFLPVWLGAVIAFSVFFVPTIAELLGTEEEMTALAEMMTNPAMVAMCGILYGDTPSVGIIFTQLMIVWSAVLVAVMNILIVIRHTRTDEDEGRQEVVRSLPVGRGAHLVAVAVLMVGINLALAIVAGLIMPAFGVESIDLAGSLVYAAALGGCGLFFAGLTMAAGQLLHSARSVTGAMMAVMGGFYMLRAYGDVGSEPAAWMSPFGLIQRAYPFYTNQWGPVVILVGIGLGLMVAALALNRLRDLGQGLLPVRAGRHAHASKLLGGEWGLAWRLNRGTIIGWGVGFAVIGAMYASALDGMEEFVLSNPIYQAMMGIGATTTDIMAPVVTTFLLINALLGAIPVLMVANALNSEESKGRMDYVISKKVSRTRVFAGYAVLVMITAVAMQLLTALGFWPVADWALEDPLPASLIFKVAFNFGPALVFLGGLVLFLVGWAKKFTWIGWGYVVASFLLVMLGGILNLPRWVSRLTPYGLLPRWPMEEFSWLPWLGLMVAGIGLSVLGAVGYRRRDIIT